MKMKALTQYIRRNPLSVFLVAFPLALLAEWLHWGSIWVFFLSALGVVPMAGYIGSATESLAAYTGPKIGGLLNATLGNAAELIITLMAIKAGYLELVKASITGSIIGNILFVLGLSMLLGGIKNGLQVFDRRQAGNHCILLTLSVLALTIPSLFSHSIGEEGSVKVEILSLGVAVVMIVLYVLGIIYSLKGFDNPLSHKPDLDHGKAEYKASTAIIILALATFGVVILSELLVGAVEVVVSSLGISEFFLGIILIPIVGNVAEHLVAVQVAIRNKMELSVEIAVSSSIQIALFVAPLLVFISLLMGNPLTLIFNQFELIALGAGIIIAALVAWDGESNWLEGASLVAVYSILSLSFFLMP